MSAVTTSVDVRALGQRQFKPARTIGVTTANLSARLLDRMRDVFAPFRLRMIFTAIREHAQLAVRRGCECKTYFLSERVRIGRKMIIRAAVAFGFRMKISVLNVEAHRQTHVGING